MTTKCSQLKMQSSDGEIARRGGTASKIVKEHYEKETKREVLSNKNAIGDRYNNKKMITKK